MPLYFFHVYDGVVLHDEEGTDLPDIYRAQAMAVRTAGEMLRDHGKKFWDRGEWRLEVCDAANEPLFDVTVKGSERIPRLQAKV